MTTQFFPFDRESQTPIMFPLTLVITLIWSSNSSSSRHLLPPASSAPGFLGAQTRKTVPNVMMEPKQVLGLLQSQTPIMFQIIKWFNFIIPIDIDPFSNAHIGQNTVHRMVHHLNYNELPPGLVQTVWQKGLKTIQADLSETQKEKKIVKWRIIEIGHCDFTKKNVCKYLKLL